MSAASPMKDPGAFRLRLLLAMMLLVAGVTAIAIYITQRKLASEAAAAVHQQFGTRLASLHAMQEVRHAALTERCRALVRKPRIHAALEDNALDLLYPSAQDELRDILEDPRPEPDGPEHALNAEFYRFLDASGKVLSPSEPNQFGRLAPADEPKLSLKRLPRSQQLEYLRRADSISEVINVPIHSTETGDVIASLALGFKPLALDASRAVSGLRSGVLLEGELFLPGFEADDRKMIASKIAFDLKEGSVAHSNLKVEIGGVPHLIFYTLLNPGSLYRRAWQVSVFALDDLLARQQQSRWQILSAAGLILLAGFVASHWFSGRLTVPVEQLARVSETHRAGREQAEAALEQTSAELQRSARFSADASHQLKTPVTVMRAGLEELLAREELPPPLREEVSDLIHQTFRLSIVVDDLLLLSRMDAGRLRLELGCVDLSLLVASEADDLTVQPNPLEIRMETAMPARLEIRGEKRYATMIVRNLLENARKYNRQGGEIRVRARVESDFALLSISNTGNPIPAAARENIFERFHRGTVGENIPGHGLGLNLARELARAHGGDLRLVRSENGWTEFEARFPLARGGAVTGI